MTDNKDNEKSFLDKLTGSLGKISALVAVIAAIVTGVVKIVGVLPDKEPPAVVDEGNCVTLEMVTNPPNVSVTEWKNTLELRLQGKNECKERVNAYVHFKAKGVQLQLATPLYCTDREDPDCWETSTLETGDVDWLLTNPELKMLSDQLPEPVPIEINWSIRDADGKQILLSRKTTVTVRQDDQVVR